VAADRALDRPGFGPQWLRDPRIGALVVESIQIGESRSCYELDAWVVMPNHVHLSILPRVPVPAILRWLKSWTARQANQLLGRSGQPFWQDESYDLYWVRNRRQRDRMVRYIEDHPVSAGLLASAEQWGWSSAGGQRHRLPHRSTPALPIPVRKCRNSRHATFSRVSSIPNTNAAEAGYTFGTSRPPRLRNPEEAVVQVVGVDVPAGDNPLRVVGGRPRALTRARSRAWSVERRDSASG